MTSYTIDEPEYIATFTPEEWQGDNAVEVDPQGSTEWIATAAVIGNWAYFAALEAHETHDGFNSEAGLLDNDDVLKADPNAPKWVRDWSGPFTIRVKRTDTQAATRHTEPPVELKVELVVELVVSVDTGAVMSLEEARLVTLNIDDVSAFLDDMSDSERSEIAAQRGQSLSTQ